MLFFNAMCRSKVRLNGKTVVITGANSGIGKETARDLYARGARVILACRNMEKAKEAIEDIKNNPPSRVKRDEYQNVGELAIYFLDLCSLNSVRECAKNLLTNEAAIHILINNAGVAMHPYAKTEDGNETTIQSNHLVGDINFDDINLERSYSPTKAYTQSKLANILFTKELARRLKEANIHGINVYSLHPGLIPTEISRYSSGTIFWGANFCWRSITWLFFKNIEQGAQTTIYCSVDENVANETGLYYSNCEVTNPCAQARNDHYAKNLWDISCRLLHLEPEEDLMAFLENVSRQIS